MEETFITVLFSFGFILLISSFLPSFLRKFRLSFVVPIVLLGAVNYLVFPKIYPNINDLDVFMLRFSEFVVILSLMNAGLKIGTVYTLKDWYKPIRLVLISMPIFILLVVLVLHYVLNLEMVSSILIASVLAPTDPVLASEIQLENKQFEHDKNQGLRYTITGEAGLNDGLAFPFIYLAILCSNSGGLSTQDLFHWLSFYVAFKILIGVLTGIGVGLLYGYLLSKLNKKQISKIHNGFIALALMMFSYGLSEFLQGYGFLSVFFTGIFSQHHLKEKLKEKRSTIVKFPEELEKVLIVFWLVFFIGICFQFLPSNFEWDILLFAFLIIIILRPIISLISLLKIRLNFLKKLAVSFYGIRGIGSVYYMYYAFQNGNFDNKTEIMSIVFITLVLSLIIHGGTVKMAVKYFEKHNPG